MKKWIVRFASLYVFNVAVLLLMGLLPGVTVGWAAFWASVILTAATIWLKPLIAGAFTRTAAKSAEQRTRAGEKLVQFALVFAVEWIVWLLVVWFSAVNVTGWFWGWVLPPVALFIAWIVYDSVDDRIEAQASRVYDKATAGRVGRTTDAAPSVDSPEAAAGRRELRDGLTDEQRKMLDDLG